MATVHFIKGLGIASLSGRLGNCIFYTRNGKQFVRQAGNPEYLPSIVESLSGQHREFIESSSSQHRV